MAGSRYRLAGTPARLQHVDVDAVIAAYQEGDAPVREICGEHRIGWSTLYRILDDHHTPRRESDHAARIPQAVEDEIVRAFHTGESLLSIASRLGVSKGTVSNVRRRHYGPLVLVRRHDELVDLIVGWLFGGRPSETELDAIARVGVVTRLPGFQSIEHIHPELRAAVAERIAVVVSERWSAT